MKDFTLGHQKMAKMSLQFFPRFIIYAPIFETTLTEVTFFLLYFKIVEKPTPAKKQRLMPMSKKTWQTPLGKTG